MAEKKISEASTFRKLKKAELLQLIEDLLSENEHLKRHIDILEGDQVAFLQLFEYAPDALFLMDSVTKKISHINKEAARLFGVGNLNHVLGTSAYDFLQDLYSEQTRNEINQVLDLENKWASEVELKTLSGATFWADVAICRLKINNRNCQLGRIYDISTKVQARQELEFNEQMYKRLAEHIPGIVYVCDKEYYDILYLCNKTEDILGFSADAFINNEVIFSQLYHPDDKERVTEAIEKAMASHQPYHLEYRMRTKDGPYCWIEDHGMVIKVNEKDVVQGVMLNASEKKAAEQELNAQNEYLTKVNAELDSFAYSVSHDLRAPINSAMGLLELLKDDPDSPRRDQFIELSRKSLHKLDDFIQDVINISKNARVGLSLSEIEFAPMVEDILDDLRFESTYDKIRLQLDIHQKHNFVSDPQRVRVVLNNLLSNAFRYSDAHKEDPFVRIELQSTPEGISCSVIDNGVGIEEKHLEEIFKMFYRAHDHIKGSGLGLYLVKETIERLKGKIEVQSEYRKGSTFRFELPNLGRNKSEVSV
ncbi:MAG: PAS domain S-box protein [Cyclobacteriaceae bacterium]